jgi:hypothetical protein
MDIQAKQNNIELTREMFEAVKIEGKDAEKIMRPSIKYCPEFFMSESGLMKVCLMWAMI